MSDLMEIELKKQVKNALFNAFIKREFPDYDEEDEPLTQETRLILKDQFETYLNTLKRLPKDSEFNKVRDKIIDKLSGDHEVKELFGKLRSYRRAKKHQEQSIQNGIGKEYLEKHNERMGEEHEAKLRQEQRIRQTVRDKRNEERQKELDRINVEAMKRQFKENMRTFIDALNENSREKWENE